MTAAAVTSDAELPQLPEFHVWRDDSGLHGRHRKTQRIITAPTPRALAVEAVAVRIAATLSTAKATAP